MQSQQTEQDETIDKNERTLQLKAVSTMITIMQQVIL